MEKTTETSEVEIDAVLDELEQLDELEAKELKEGMAFHLFRFR